MDKATLFFIVIAMQIVMGTILAIYLTKKICQSSDYQYSTRKAGECRRR